MWVFVIDHEVKSIYEIAFMVFSINIWADDTRAYNLRDTTQMYIFVDWLNFVEYWLRERCDQNFEGFIYIYTLCCIENESNRLSSSLWRKLLPNSMRILNQYNPIMYLKMNYNSSIYQLKNKIKTKACSKKKL